jgi:hypothetical protein
MIEKGTMRPIKKIMGIVLILAGAGLIFMQEQTIEILCGNKIILAILLAISGYFLIKSGRQL